MKNPKVDERILNEKTVKKYYVQGTMGFVNANEIEEPLEAPVGDCEALKDSKN